MPFNGSGTFSIVNTFVPNTTILSAAVNQNFTDIATGLTDCLTRDGQAGMTAIFKAISGTVSAPGIAFTSDTTAGLYLSTTGIIGLVAKSLGLLVNSSIRQVSSAAIQAGGSGYAVGDVLVASGGTSIIAMNCSVATVSGGVVTSVTVTHPGDYSVVPSNPASTIAIFGSGTGCTLNLTFATQFTTSVVTNEAGALPWQRLGASSFVSGLMGAANRYNFLRALFTPGSGIVLTNNDTAAATLATTLNPTLVPNYISGLTLSTAGSSTTMTIAAGVANDSTNTTLMNLSSAIAKTTSGWAVGTGNGGLDTGAISPSTWYHFHEIERPDTGVVDILISLSASSPTMPTNYTLRRRIGSGFTNGSSQWTGFTQVGNYFVWTAPVTDVNNIATTTSRVNTALSVPTGVQVLAKYRAGANGTLGNTATIFTCLSENDQTPVITVNASMAAASGGFYNGQFETLTTTSALIGVRSANTNGNISIVTFGWQDFRGQ